MAEAYRRKGYTVIENPGRGADGGVDIRLQRDGQLHLVQCKQWQSRKVGVNVVREMYGLMTAESAASAIVICSGIFTQEAKNFAEGKAIDLVDGAQLEALIGQVRGTQRETATPSRRRQPSATLCPRCGSPLVLRTAQKGCECRRAVLWMLWVSELPLHMSARFPRTRNRAYHVIRQITSAVAKRRSISLRLIIFLRTFVRYALQQPWLISEKLLAMERRQSRKSQLLRQSFQNSTVRRMCITRRLHYKLPHPWPGQIPPSEAAGRVDGYTLSARFATRAAASRSRQLLPSNFSRCAWCISRSSSGVTMTTSPSSVAQSSTGRLDVMIVERFS